MIRKVLPLLLLVLASCGRNKDQVEIKGQFEGLQQAQFYLYSEDYNFGSLDTLFLEDGKFSYKRALQQPVVLTLLFPNFSEIQIIAEPGKTIEVEGNAAHLLETKITGSEENELLSDFRISSQKLSEKEKKMAVADFIHSHPKSQAAVALYMQQFAKAEAPDAEVALELLGTLRKAQPENRMLLQIDTQQRAAETAVQALAAESGQTVYVSIEPFKSFYRAEEEHQDYYLKHPEEFKQELIDSGRIKS